MSQRHHEVTRLEGFSDAVFGFALTLLVVSLDVPSNVQALMLQMHGFIGFALMFAMVCYIWWEHNKFFRRYGLQDAWTVFLNAVLLFVVLFYVYPLKFLTTALMNEFLWRTPATVSWSVNDGSRLMVLYDIGVIAIFAAFVLLYQHAWRQRAQLGLTRADEIALRFGRRGHVISASLGVVSLAIVLIAPTFLAVAGFIFFLMGPLHGWNGYQAGKALDLARKKEAVLA
jgi:uncharacterized membrane protein